MLTLTGKVMKSIPGSYVNKQTQQAQAQLELVIWPDDPNAKDSMVVRFDHTYFSDAAFLQNMAKLEGQDVSLSVRIFSFRTSGYALLATSLPKIRAVASAPARQAS